MEDWADDEAIINNLLDTNSKPASGQECEFAKPVAREGRK